MKNFTKYLLLITLIFSIGNLVAQPVDNPFASKYEWARTPNRTLQHWTYDIKWGNVIDIKNNPTYNSLVKKTALYHAASTVKNDWIDAYNKARDDLAAQGGGVIYFEALGFNSNFLDSTYYFSKDIELATGVVIRGEQDFICPTVSDAKQAGFQPKTLFEFPFAAISSATNYGIDTLAFRVIRGPLNQDLSYTGIVNVDINRARITIQPNFVDKVLPNRPNPTKIGTNRTDHILVMNCRMNNGSAPAKTNGNGNGNDIRYSWRFGANIDIYSEGGHVILANNRINDRTHHLATGRFDQGSTCNANYQNPENQSMPQYIVGGNTPVAGKTPYFDHTLHYGILLNRFKLIRLTNGRYATPAGFVDEATPSEEPAFWAPGNMVIDNFVMSTSRAKIQAGGLNLYVGNNKTEDITGKIAILDPVGEKYIDCNGITSYENRGIDFIGWGSLVEYNDIHFERQQRENSSCPSYSSDGEGIYWQGASGINPIDVTVRYNTIRTNTQDFIGQSTDKGFNGIANISRIENVFWHDNIGGCMPIRLDASTQQGALGLISNVNIYNNTDVKMAGPHQSAIRLAGNIAAAPSKIYNNSGGTCGAGTISRQCFTWLDQTNNCSKSGVYEIGTSGINNNTNLTSNANCNCTTTIEECFKYFDQTVKNICPVFKLSDPSTVRGAGNYSTINIDYEFGDNQRPDTIFVYVGSQVVASIPGTSVAAGSATSAVLNIPTQTLSTSNPQFNITLVAKVSYLDAALSPITTTLASESKVYTLDIINSLEEIISNNESPAIKMELFPNPSSDIAFLRIFDMANEDMVITVMDLKGSVVSRTQQRSFNAATIVKLPVSELDKGVYIVNIASENRNTSAKLIVN